MKKQNIFLIGFMGTGKSTIAAFLSEQLDREHIEMDMLIASREGMAITEIFETHGEAYFRNLESMLLIELKSHQKAIVSCGGGVVVQEENITHMKESGVIVLLTATPETILSRVKTSTERPILNNHMNTAFIAELMEKRREKYLAAADIIVSTDGKDVAAICQEIVSQTENA